MPTDFRDGHAFPRRGREALGGFLWLARVIDKARATANHTQDGYNYPCPMDRAMMRHWGVSPKDFAIAIGEHSTDDQVVEWLSQRVGPDRISAANAWLLRQNDSLDRHDAEEGVPGAMAPKYPPRDVIRGLAVAAIVLLASWLARVWHH